MGAFCVAAGRSDAQVHIGCPALPVDRPGVGPHSPAGRAGQPVIALRPMSASARRELVNQLRDAPSRELVPEWIP